MSGVYISDTALVSLDRRLREVTDLDLTSLIAYAINEEHIADRRASLKKVKLAWKAIRLKRGYISFKTKRQKGIRKSDFRTSNDYVGKQGNI